MNVKFMCMRIFNIRGWLLMGIATLLLTATSCKKGDVGPQGEQGEKGDRGEQGPGAMTKVIAAGTVTWTDVNEYGVVYKAANLALPALTNDIVTNGAVMVYAAFNFGTSQWTALPITYIAELPSGGVSIKATYNMFYTYQTGSIQVRFSRSDNVRPGAPTIGFKAVLIPGKAISLIRKNGIDMKDYAAVEVALGLKD